MKSYKPIKLFPSMLFEKTEKLIIKYNTNPSAVLPKIGDISSNNISDKNKIKMWCLHAEQVKDTHKEEYEWSNKNGHFFFGCKSKTYIHTYDRRLNEYIEKSEDSIEPEFIFSELGLFNKKFDFPFVDSETRSKIHRSMWRRDEFLLDRLDDLGYEYVYDTFAGDEIEPDSFKMYRLQRKSDYKRSHYIKPKILNLTPTEFMELFKALYDCNFCYGKQKDALASISNQLGIKINNPDKLLQDIKNRNYGSESLLLDKLKSSILKLCLKSKKEG